ncbi:ATP-binding cassette domain-containing protein [Paenibacillus sp. FSL R7-0026]|uniref:ATP-binding cassette domain-containing protein n=1 Tax=Paenibacillus sp. FSL R7-0026 TaxID=2921668 RepID=UPI0030F50FF8
MKTIDANPGYIMLDEFDSALDESRKAKVFELYRDELARKMIILSPKSHESDYLNYFSEAFAVYHDARITRSALIRIKKMSVPIPVLTHHTELSISSTSLICVPISNVPQGFND